MPRLRSETIGAGDQSWLGSAHAIWNCRTGTLDMSTFVAATHFPGGHLRSGTPLGRIATGPSAGLYGAYAGRTSEQQTVALGAATAGTIAITFDGATTAAIAFNATAAQVQAALEGLPNVNPGDVAVSGGPLPGTITLAFGGRYLGQNVPEVAVAPTGLTGGTVTVATTVQGGSAITDGRQTLAVFLFTDQPVIPGTGNIAVPLFDHGRIREARLPIPIDAAGRADVAGRIYFV